MRSNSKISNFFVMLTCLLNCLFISTKPLAELLPNSLTVTSTVYPPFVINEDGKLSGIDFDIAREAGSRLGIDIKLKLMPWLRINRNLKSGTKGLEAVVSFFKTQERTEYMDYTSIPTHITQYRLFVKQNSYIHFNQLSDLQNFKGKTIGVNSSFKTTDEIKHAKDSGLIYIEEVKTDKQNFLKLASGRIDAVLTNFHVGSYTIKKLKLDDIIHALPQSLSQTPTFLIFAKSAGLQSLVPQFNKTLAQMRSDGTYDRIYRSYGVIIDKK